MKLVIFGIGDLARMAHYYFTQDSAYEVAAFTVSNDYITQNTFMDLPLVPFETLLKTHPPDKYHLYIAIGYSKLNKVRELYYNQAKALGYKLASYISSQATVQTNQIGDNTFIFEDNTIQPFVTIGSNNVIWSGNHIGHDSTIGNHCFITSHVVLAGWSKVSDYCFLGINATVRDQVTIGDNCFIGAGALITHDIKPNSIYKANPAVPSKLPIEKLREKL